MSSGYSLLNTTYSPIIYSILAKKYILLVELDMKQQQQIKACMEGK